MSARRSASSGPAVAVAVFALAALALGTASGLAQARAGSVEVVARLIGQDFTQAWGQQVIVETRPGGGTMIGTQAAARAEPDGYTLLVAVSNHATNPALHQKMPYDALQDFEFASMLVSRFRRSYHFAARSVRTSESKGHSPLY